MLALMIKNIESLSSLHSFLSTFCWESLGFNISLSYIENSGSHFSLLAPFCCEDLSFNILNGVYER